MKTILLVDADTLAYKAAYTSEVIVDWNDDEDITVLCNKEKVRDSLDSQIEKLKETAKADEVVLALSDSTNWRLDILPTYKGNRVASRKPVGLKYAKAYLTEAYGAITKPSLEGDDVVGILATATVKRGERRVIFSLDKDLLGIPGFHLRGSDIRERPEQDADYFHLYQTLVGDTTDGYAGLPGIGPKKAQDILGEPEDGVEALWSRVVTAFTTAGLTEKDALQMAQVARICRWDDYDHKNKKVIPWTPPVVKPVA